MMFLILFSCRQTMRRMNDYLDRELSAREMRWVKSHLTICHACTAKFHFEAEFIAALRAKLDRAASLEESPELAARIGSALRQSPHKDAND